MKAEDLMIGNWVNFIPDNDNLIVSEIDAFNRWGENINGLCIEDIKPIPLTEESIVELLGFEKLEVLIGYYFSNKHNCVVDFDIKQVRLGDSECTLPKHVHKLQQLIKSLQE